MTLSLPAAPSDEVIVPWLVMVVALPPCTTDWLIGGTDAAVSVDGGGTGR